MGPIGSGKSVTCAADLVGLACEQKAVNGVRRSRTAAIRNTYPELKSTTIKTWMEWFGPLTTIKWDAPITATFRMPMPDGTRVELEILFIAVNRPDHIKKLKSLDLTFVWLNEVSELAKAIFDMACGRVWRYPSMKDGGPSWSCVLMDTNPPDSDHWYYKLAEERDGVQIKAIEAMLKEVCEISFPLFAFFRQPPALLKDGKRYVPNPLAENVRNHALGHGYWLNQVAGKTEEWIKVFLMGEYGIVQDGKPMYPEYVDSVHCAATDILPIAGVPLRLGWDFGRCYSEDTEVMTEGGWKFFRDLTAVDKVATRNPATDEVEFHVPAFGIDQEYEGDMLEWDSPEVNMLVTPEHLVACRDDHRLGELVWKSAEWLAEHNNGHWRVDVRSKWTAPEWVDPMHFGMRAEDLASLVGLYMAEGHVEKIGNSHRIAISQREPKPEMQAWLDASGLAWKWSMSGSRGMWRLTDNVLGRWLHSFGLQDARRVPRLIAEMPAHCIERFIDAYTAGDGHVRTREQGGIEHTLFTSSERMAADMQELAQKVGWNSSVRVQKGRISYMQEGATVRAIQSRDGYVVHFKKVNKTAGLHARHFRRVHYKGRIYCVNVPYHTLYVRRGGRAHWNGNTPACAISQLTPRGAWNVIDEIVGTDIYIRSFARDVVKPVLKTRYRGFDIISSCDPSGSGSGRGADDEEMTGLRELNQLDIPTEPAWSNELTARHLSMSAFMLRMVDGKPAFQLSPRCKTMRKGFQGGYQCERLAVAGEERFRDYPVKNQYSHIIEALEYSAMEVDREFTRIVRTQKRRPRKPIGSIADPSAGY